MDLTDKLWKAHEREAEKQWYEDHPNWHEEVREFERKYCGS